MAAAYSFRIMERILTRGELLREDHSGKEGEEFIVYAVEWQTRFYFLMLLQHNKLLTFPLLSSSKISPLD